MQIKIGNIFESNAKTLVNTVNCVGVMGKGIALEFKKRFPGMFEEYVRLCNNHEVKPGKPYYYSDLLGPSVINFPTKDHWRSPSKLSYIEEGLDWFRNNYASLGVTSIAFPPLGCGNGGLDWETVGPVMYMKLADLPIDIEIYAPYGTKKDLLTTGFLKNHMRLTDCSKVGRVSEKVNKYWYFILYAIRKLNNDRYSLSVGRTIYQKVCYVLTKAGIPTGFHFAKGTYGPYSKEAKQSVTILSNANLMMEKQIGKMIVTIVAPDFVFPEEKFSSVEMKKAERAIDLLCRIKSTNHAEMITSILFAYDELTNNMKQVNDLDLLSAVLEWKKKYDEEGRREEVSRMIENLSSIGWINPNYTGKLPNADEGLY